MRLFRYLSIHVSSTQMLINKNPSDVQVLRPIDLGPCTELEEIQFKSPRCSRLGAIHFFDSATCPHLSVTVLHFLIPFNSRKIDLCIYRDDWSGVEESLCRLAERLQAMHESQYLVSVCVHYATEVAIFLRVNTICNRGSCRRRRRFSSLIPFFKKRSVRCQLDGKQAGITTPNKCTDIRSGWVI